MPPQSGLVQSATESRPLDDTNAFTVLFTVWPLESHVRPFLVLAHALKSRGHRVFFYAEPSLAWRDELSAFPCFPYREVRATRIEEILRKLSSGAVGRFEARSLWKEFLLDSIPAQISDLRSVIANCRPDVIVTDIAMWSPFLILGELLNIPVVPFAHTAHCILPGPDGPVVGLTIPRLKSKLLRHLTSLAGKHLMGLFSDRLRKQANEIRASYALPPIPGTMTEFSGTMPLYLMPGSPEFDYRREDLAESVQYLGSCSEDPRGAQGSGFQKVSAESPRILIDSCLPFARPDFVEQIVAEISPLGMKYEVGNAYSLATSLRSAGVAITNANSPMVLAALGCGVPLLAIPDALESGENGRRVEAYGCGIRIPSGRMRAGRVREAVTKILSEPSYRQKANRLSTSFETQGGVIHASKLVEELVLSQRWQSKTA